MKSIRALAGLSFLVPSLLAATPAPQTTYALSGIVQLDPSTGGGRRGREAAAAGSIDDASALAAIGTTRLLYSSDGPPLRAVLAARNRLKLTTPVLVYMGGFTTNGEDVPAIERDYRSGVAMVPIAKLADAIEAETTEFKLTDPVDGELAVKASTADVSDPKDSSKFCFWLRLEDELVKVTAVDSKSGRITVTRGFGSSQATAHAAGTRAFGPVYVGNRNQLGAARHSNSWPAGPDYLRYAVDPRTPAAAKFRAANVSRFMKAGYDGAWFDTFQPVPYNLCDALGRPVSYFWDFAGGQLYNFDSYLDAIKTYVRNVRTNVRAATGREPVLYANSATRSYARGVKTLFNHGDTRDLLDGYCFEDAYLKVRAEREKGKGTAAQAAFLPITGDKWLTNVTNHADCARAGLSGICMAGPAGYLAAYINPTQDNYAQLVRFAYASYLLTVTPARTTSFGLPLLVTRTEAAPWPPLLFAALGDPMQPNEPAGLKLSDSPCYARAFAHGWVAVNPSAGGAPVTVTAPDGCIDAFTKQPVTKVAIAPGDAVILLKAAAN